MRILHIITGLQGGGAEGVLARMVLSDRRNEHIVLSLTDRGVYGDVLESKGVKLITLNFKNSRINVWPFIKLCRAILRSDAQVVQTWMYHSDLLGGLAARIVGIRSVVWCVRRSSLRLSDTGLGTKLVSQMCIPAAACLPAKIIFCSRAGLSSHCDAGYPRKKAVWIPNGFASVDSVVEDSTIRDLRTNLSCDQDIPILACVARFDRSKDHSNLMRALSKLKERGVRYTCVLVGAGMDSHNKILSAEIKSCGLEAQVRLLGERRDIPLIMKAVDLHVLSSRSEGFPNVLAESMLYGTPCVATDVGDSAAILGEIGWVVPKQNSDALAAALQEAISEIGTETWSERCKNGSNWIGSKFSIENMVGDYEAVWKKVIHS